MDELEERVRKFNSLQLPGQPMTMHMGTSYLVNDLWREVRRLRRPTPRAADGLPVLECAECGESTSMMHKESCSTPSVNNHTTQILSSEDECLDKLDNQTA